VTGGQDGGRENLPETGTSRMRMQRAGKPMSRLAPLSHELLP
jgi:hypothetical protein